MNDWTRFVRLLPYLKADTPYYLLAFALAPAAAVLAVLQPYLLKLGIDSYIANNDIQGIRNLSLAYLAAVIFAFFCEAGYTLAISYGASRSIARFRDEVYQHTLSLNQSFFDVEPTGKLLTRATSDVDALGETLSAGAITIVLDVLLVLGILAAMFSLEPKLSLALLLLAPPLILAIEGIRRILRRLFQKVRTTLAVLSAYTTERIEGLLIVQLYSDEKRALAQYTERNNAFRDTNIQTNFWDAFLFALVDGVSSLAIAGIFVYAWSTGSVLEIGLFAAFIDYLGKLFTPIREFSQKLAVIQRASSALEKIFSLLDTKAHISHGAATADLQQTDLVIKDLRFSYRQDTPDVLKGIDLTLRNSEVVALVGRTGSGKSTLSKILLRTYDGYRGSIQYAGAELSDLPAAFVRAQIAMVHQDVQLFPGDVRFNLTLGHNISDERLHTAIDLAQATTTVERLGGLDGIIRHQAQNLSVGEAQLLSFARTLAHDPPIVILDEATASVDTLTEAKIQQATRYLLQSKTVLVVAHRLSTIKNANRILVLDGGRVLEEGTHQELLANHGPYYNLYHHQFEDSTNGSEEA